MSKTLAFVLALFCNLTLLGQSFEGQIIYQNSYTSKMANVSDKQLSDMMGSTQEYFVKNGNYKSITNGTFFQWQLYMNAENKLYSKMSNSETVFWNDGAVNSDEVTKAEVNKGVTEILGYKCDELVLTCKSGIQRYYFNSQLAVDSKLFVDHKFGNWFEFVSRSNSLPLKSIIENGQFTLECVAIEINRKSLDAAMFNLPADTKTIKSPY